MKKLWVTLLALVAFGTSVSSARAVTLSLAPVSQTVASGATGQIEVDIQGLPRPGPPSLGAFDLTLSDSLGTLSYTSVVFSTELGDPTLNQALTSSTAPAAGSVELKEVSLLPAATLDAGEATSFTLATISFVAGAPGTTSLGISKITLSDGLGAPLTTTGVSGASVLVVLPEPASGVLLAAGLGSLSLAARRRLRCRL